MKQSMHTDDLAGGMSSPILTFLITLLAIVLSGCGADQTPFTAYRRAPVFDREFVLTDGGDTLVPTRLQMRHDTLFVAYYGVARIDLYDSAMTRIGRIPLVDPEPLLPTSFAVGDSMLYIVDHAKGAFIVTGLDGTFRSSFDKLPDGTTALSPLAVTFHGGVAYIADVALRQILAVSMVDAPGVTEMGELILRVPAAPDQAIGYPSALRVTLDGRLLVGDAGTGQVRVFTCDGRWVYDFDAVPASRRVAPQGFAVDGVTDPSLQDSSRFDPSMVHTHGRYHVVDGNNAKVHMFSPFGSYIISYPSDRTLTGPSDIAIDTKHALIYIAEPRSGRLLRYRYEG